MHTFEEVSSIVFTHNPHQSATWQNCWGRSKKEYEAPGNRKV